MNRCRNFGLAVTKRPLGDLAGDRFRSELSAVGCGPSQHAGPIEEHDISLAVVDTVTVNVGVVVEEEAPR